MKRRILLYGGLLVSLVVISISTGLMLREYHHQQASHTLIVAIKAKHISTALTALKAGADPNTREDALPSRSFSAFIKQLLDKCFHPRPKTAPSADKPLAALALHFKVSKTYDPSLVKALLEAGADPNVTILDSGASPLLWAAMDGDTQVVRLLLQYHANPGVVDSNGVTTLQGASMVIGNVSIPDKVKCVSLLLNAGANINAQDNSGGTALMFACMEPGDENIEIVRTLLQHHADPCLRYTSDTSETTALDFALERDDPQTIKLLRQAGAKTARELAMKQAVTQHSPHSNRGIR